ncbi:hypothetical protein [Kitasatospora sp. NPDC058190]|uniref:hypothetical protein n=1 Tax=Kitasatospora sp. NPDC058190 TaxID=3346371 RepID=UPI0036DE10CE
MTSNQLPRGLTTLIPQSRATTASERAAAQLLHLREATVPVPVLAAAAELIAPRLDDPDPAIREAPAPSTPACSPPSRTPRPVSSDR